MDSSEPYPSRKEKRSIYNQLNPKKSKIIKDETIDENNKLEETTLKNQTTKRSEVVVENKIIFIFKNEKNNITFNNKDIINACPILNTYSNPIEGKVFTN